LEASRTCPNCRALISRADRVCPYCEFQLEAPRAAGPVREWRRGDEPIAGLIPPQQFCTSLLLFVNVALFIASSLTEVGRNLVEAGASFGPAIFTGKQYWRLLTAGFFHGGVMHILMNSWGLFSLGAQVETLYGARKFIVFYFVSTVTGFFVSAKLLNGVSVGASAGLFGLLGVMLAVAVVDRSAVGGYLRAQYGQYVIFAIVTSFIPGIDWAAHLGGFVGGFACAYFAGHPAKWGPENGAFWNILAGICLALTLGAFAMMLRYFALLR
jgi:rhomboid protease GluP